MHGAGEIVGIDEKEVLGKVETYYEIKIPTSNMLVMIPVKKASELGVRYITDPTRLKEIFTELQNFQVDKEKPWKDTFKIIMEKIKSGDIKDTLKIYKCLTARSKEKNLNINEKNLLNKVKQFLISEICLSQNINEHEAEDLLLSS